MVPRLTMVSILCEKLCPNDYIDIFIYFQTHVIDLEINKICIYGKYIFFVVFRGIVKTHNNYVEGK